MAFEHNDIVTVNRMNEAISEGGGGGLIFPEFTIDGDNETATCDMTFADIAAATEAGRCVMAKDNEGNTYVLKSADDSAITFSRTAVESGNGAYEVHLAVLADGTVQFSVDEYPSTP